MTYGGRPFSSASFLRSMRSCSNSASSAGPCCDEPVVAAPGLERVDRLLPVRRLPGQRHVADPLREQPLGDQPQHPCELREHEDPAPVGELLCFAVDEVKPKRDARLARLADIARDPRVALLVDHYIPNPAVGP